MTSLARNAEAAPGSLVQQAGESAPEHEAWAASLLVDALKQGDLLVAWRAGSYLMKLKDPAAIEGPYVQNIVPTRFFIHMDPGLRRRLAIQDHEDRSAILGRTGDNLDAIDVWRQEYKEGEGVKQTPRAMAAMRHALIYGLGVCRWIKQGPVFIDKNGRAKLLTIAGSDQQPEEVAHEFLATRGYSPYRGGILAWSDDRWKAGGADVWRELMADQEQEDFSQEVVKPPQGVLRQYPASSRATSLTQTSGWAFE